MLGCLRTPGRHKWQVVVPGPDNAYAILSGHELLEKLAAIVPPPRSDTTRYHGILAHNAKQRAKVVPAESTWNTPSEERKKSGFKEAFYFDYRHRLPLELMHPPPKMDAERIKAPCPYSPYSWPMFPCIYRPFLLIIA